MAPASRFIRTQEYHIRPEKCPSRQYFYGDFRDYEGVQHFLPEF